MLSGRKITVLGGGIAGLAAATALARRGADVCVLEQANAIREVGAGLQISPNGAAVLAALGLGERLAGIGMRGRAVTLREGRTGRKVLSLNLSRGAGPYHFVHRADLIGLLADAARAAGVRIRLLQKVASVRPDDDRACLVTAQGATIPADLVIGADGLHSVLRGAVDGPARPRFTGQVAWRAVVPADGPVPPVATVHMGPRRHMVSYPLRDGAQVNIVAVEERRAWTAESWTQTDDAANLRAAFAGFAPEVRALLDRVETVHLWGLFRHPVAAHWHRAGVAALIGDAAHPTLPFMAQGANMALEDAWVLAAMLAADDDTARALAAFQAARRDRCMRIVAAASRNARNYHLRFPPLRMAAHSALRLGGWLAPQRILSRFDWIYGYDAPRAFP